MLRPENTGLIVVDIQGKLARLVHDSKALIANCEKLINGSQVLGLPIIFLEQNPDKLGGTVDELKSIIESFNPVTKYTFNGCAEPNFINILQAEKIETWLVCGIEAHICVYQTAVGLLDLGYNVQLVNDCVSSRSQQDKALGVSRLKSEGAIITGVEMCLYELLQDCRKAEFKPILNLIR